MTSLRTLLDESATLHRQINQTFEQDWKNHLRATLSCDEYQSVINQMTRALCINPYDEPLLAPLLKHEWNLLLKRIEINKNQLALPF